MGCLDNIHRSIFVRNKRFEKTLELHELYLISQFISEHKRIYVRDTPLLERRIQNVSKKWRHTFIDDTPISIIFMYETNKKSPLSILKSARLSTYAVMLWVITNSKFSSGYKCRLIFLLLQVIKKVTDSIRRSHPQ